MLNLFEKGIPIIGIEMLINPKKSIQIGITNVGNIVRKPNRHIDKGRLIAI